MNLLFLTTRELEEALDITGYDIYQYSRRGLPIVQSNPTLYDLEEVREWIAGFSKREDHRTRIKEEIIQRLSEDEKEIVLAPKEDNHYAVLWKSTDKREELILLRTIYLMVMHSTTNGVNIVYLSENRKAAEEVEKLVQEKAKGQAKEFKAYSFKALAKDILADKGLYLLYASDEFITKKAIQVLKEDPEFLEESNLKYRHLIIEKLEKTNTNQRQLIELLSAQQGEFMLNVAKKAFNQSEELGEWIERLEEIEIIER